MTATFSCDIARAVSRGQPPGLAADVELVPSDDDVAVPVVQPFQSPLSDGVPICPEVERDRRWAYSISRLANAAMPAIGSPETQPVTDGHVPRDENRPEAITLAARAVGRGGAVNVPLTNVATRICPEVVGQGGTCARESQPECARCQ